MSKLLTVIVEDEDMALKHIQRMCEKVDDIEVVESFQSGLEAMNFLKNSSEIDLVLLDVEMPDFSGIDLLKTLKDHPQIIFTTSKAEYAVDAFELQATDFLTKPIQLPRFFQAIERAKQPSETKIASSEASKGFVQARETGYFSALYEFTEKQLCRNTDLLKCSKAESRFSGFFQSVHILIHI